MSTSSADFAEVYAGVLRGFGLSRSDLGDAHVDDGPLTAETVAWDLDLDDPDDAYRQLQGSLATSTRGIEAPRRYWSQAPAFQLSDVLEPYGYEITFEGLDGGEFRTADGGFEICLEGGEVSNRTTFTYPAEPYGEDDYPALVHAVETRLLPRGDLRFVRLDGDEDAWRFVLAEAATLDDLRSEFGERVRVFGRPLLAAEQPSDVADRISGPDAGDGPTADLGLAGDFDSVVSVSGIDEVFETMERAAATQPVGAAKLDDEPVDEEVGEILESVEGPTGVASPPVREIPNDRLDEVVDSVDTEPGAIGDAADQFRWMRAQTIDDDPTTDDDTLSSIDGDDEDSTGDDAGDGSGSDANSGRSLKAEHIPSPAPGVERSSGLSDQVRATLYEADADETDGGSGGERQDGDGVSGFDETTSASETDRSANDETATFSVADEDASAHTTNPFERVDEVDDEAVVDASDVMRPIVEDGSDEEDEDEQGTIGRLTDTVRNMF